MLCFLGTRLIGGLRDHRTKFALSARIKLEEVADCLRRLVCIRFDALLHHIFCHTDRDDLKSCLSSSMNTGTAGLQIKPGNWNMEDYAWFIDGMSSWLHFKTRIVGM